VEKRKNACTVLVEKLEQKKPPVKYRLCGRINIKMYLKEIETKGLD
jgi:hypothetical protein